jgi:magnesium chelatase subunit D
MGGGTLSNTERFPFSAVVGQDDAKLALLLVAIEPRIGGVLLRGQKGSAKTTLARGLAALLPDDSPFVELPLGATEDRVIGTLDIAAAVTGGEVRFHPGLLAGAHRGVLYVDEINLLADHLVDTLLDVAVSGVNIVEREGVSHRHAAQFVLVGSMNPEEGELRPQLLDRFGLCVSVTAPAEVDDRVEVLRRRLAFDRDPLADNTFTTEDERFTRAVAETKPADVPDEVLIAAARLAVAVGAEGMRADLTLCRAAAAHAGLTGRSSATIEDLRRIAPLVLAHRTRRGPFDPPTLGPQELERALTETFDDATSQPEDTQSDQPPGGGGGTARDRPFGEGPQRQAPHIERPTVASARGRMIRDVAASVAPDAPMAILATVRDLAGRRGTDPSARVTSNDVRAAVRESRVGRLVILAVDLSGSMGAPDRAEAASGTVLGLLTEVYEERHQVALVGFRGEGAEVLLAPTSSVEVARNRIGRLTTGGATPLAEGIRAAIDLATARRASSQVPLVVLLTDGRATGAPDALDRALAAASNAKKHRVACLVLDCESGPTRLGLAASVADAMGARCLAVADLEAAAICSIIQRAIAA